MMDDINYRIISLFALKSHHAFRNTLNPSSGVSRHVFSHKKIKLLSIVMLLLVLPFSGRSQACCAGGVPVGGSLGLGTAAGQEIQVLATFDYNSLNDLVDRRELLVDDTRKRSTFSSIIEVNYGVTPRLSVATVIPHIRQERFIRSDVGSDHTVAQGLGDVLLLVKYRVLQSSTTNPWEWVVGGGPMMPTGRSDLRNNTGLTMVADMQPGSGSWDALFWSYLQKSNFGLPQLSLMSITTIRRSGTNSTYNGTQRYSFGNEFQTNWGLNYAGFVKWPIDFFLLGRYRRQSADLIDGNYFPGSGGEWISLVPGINISFAEVFSLRAFAEVPLIRNLEGTQLTTTARYTVAFFYSIRWKNDPLQLQNQ